MEKTEAMRRAAAMAEGAVVTQVTVSKSFDTYRGGEKRSHFVSMNFSPPEPLTAAEAEIFQLYCARTVSRCVHQDALAEGSITVDEYNQRLSEVLENHDKLIEKKIRKASQDV